jgi:hypothetical protein
VAAVTAREALDAAKGLRMPRLTRKQGTRERLDSLEDYMLETAWHRAELMEGRMAVYEDLHTLKEEWDHLDGWQALKRTKTETAVEDAKRQLRPDIYNAIQKAEWLIARLTEQMERLDREATICSRAFTFATGG